MRHNTQGANKPLPITFSSTYNLLAQANPLALDLMLTLFIRELIVCTAGLGGPKEGRHPPLPLLSELLCFLLVSCVRRAFCGLRPALWWVPSVWHLCYSMGGKGGGIWWCGNKREIKRSLM